MRQIRSLMAAKGTANGKKVEKQALHHGEKNVVITTAKTKRVSYLSQTYPGKTQDKKVADTGNISYLEQIALHNDNSFQGYEPND